MAPEPPTKTYPLYSTTFSLHRLSPLYTGLSTSLTNNNLQPYAHRLRDILTGEVLRGVRVGLGVEDDALAGVGALKSVRWRLLGDESSWEDSERGAEGGAENEGGMGEDTTMELEGASSRGMVVEIGYEKMGYKAVMLQDDRQDSDMDRSTSATNRREREESEGFQHFPLLLLKMPLSLRETFLSFLSSTFDTRVSNLHLSSNYLTQTFSHYLNDLSLSGDDDGTINPIQRNRILRNTIKETIITIGFDLSSSGFSALKTIDIQIAREDLPGMIAAGRKMESGNGSGKEPFFDALAAYVKAHMALDLKHERVRIVRIACGAFVLGSEGRVKMWQPLGVGTGGEGEGDDNENSPQKRAVRRLVNGLVKVAEGEGKLGASVEKT